MKDTLYRFVSPVAIVALALTGCSDDAVAPVDTGPIGFSRMMGSSLNDQASDAVVLSDGLRLVTGTFEDTLRITGVGGTLVAQGNNDTYVAAFNPDGSLAWRRRYGGDAGEAPFAVARDGSNNIYIAGTYNGDTNFGGTDLTGFGSNDVLVAKLDADGNPVWTIGNGGGGFDWATDVAMASDGGIFLCGRAESQFTLGGEVVGAAGQRGFLVKLSSLGGGIWSATAGGPSASTFEAVARAGDGSVFVCGDYIGGDMTIAGSTLAVDGGYDSFIAHYSDAATGMGAIRIGGSGSSRATGIAMVGDELVVVGSLNDTVDFDVATVAGEVTSLGSADAFVVRYRSDGSIRWLRRFGSAGAESARGVYRVGESGVVVCGRFDGTVFFDSEQLTTNGGSDIFVVRLDGNGDVVWATSIGSAGDDLSPAVTASGEFVIAVGAVAGDTRFPSGSVLAGFGEYDGFVYQR